MMQNIETMKKGIPKKIPSFPKVYKSKGGGQ
jgi:hypothetical protein